MAADAEAIAGVHVRSWQVGYRGQLPDDLLEALDPADRVPRWAATLAATSWPDHGTLVIEGAWILGFAHLRPSRDADQDPDTTGEIASFYVDPASWGQGRGRRLMTAAVAELADRYRTGTLWVLETNARARTFYEATGWTPDDGVRDDRMAGVEIRDLRYRRDLHAPARGR